MRNPIPPYEGGFVAFPRQTLQLALRELSPTEFKLWVNVFAQAQPWQKPHVTRYHQDIADECGLGLRTVRRTMPGLARQGAISERNGHPGRAHQYGIPQGLLPALRQDGTTPSQDGTTRSQDGTTECQAGTSYGIKKSFESPPKSSQKKTSIASPSPAAAQGAGSVSLDGKTPGDPQARAPDQLKYTRLSDEQYARLSDVHKRRAESLRVGRHLDEANTKAQVARQERHPRPV